ncbi:hypothetical protein TNCV_5098621 [Trichonephila clavipes]|uniref:Uncharacterized protein n=1 Tax=Trichonephila clavipes TaxID=2585209 RepID=A0A8X6S4S9_TRICX|nr:hypothetical protein TNCV_5098621 [Trichonephila clavipes]
MEEFSGLKLKGTSCSISGTNLCRTHAMRRALSPLDGYDDKLGAGVSRVRVLVPLMTRRTEESMHAKYAEAQTSSRLCGVEVRRGSCQLGRSWCKIPRSVANSPRAAL